ncbi:MAG: carboxypeptidase-like regulatory domain-containing protein [Acidobacteriota bacterium]
MTGDERMRFCSECQKEVYNFSTMTRREIESLVQLTGGRFCARVIRDADDSVITAETKAVRGFSRFQASKFATAVLTATLTLYQNAFGQSLKANQSQKTIQIDSQPERATEKQDVLIKTATFRGTVYVQSRAVIVGAELTIQNLSNKQVFTTKTDEAGAFEIASLTEGLYKIKIESRGFITFRKNWFPIQAGTLDTLNITLLVGSLGEVVYVGGQPSLYEKFTEKITQPIRDLGNFLRRILP